MRRVQKIFDISGCMAPSRVGTQFLQIWHHQLLGSTRQLFHTPPLYTCQHLEINFIYIKVKINNYRVPYLLYNFNFGQMRILMTKFIQWIFIPSKLFSIRNIRRSITEQYQHSVAILFMYSSWTFVSVANWRTLVYISLNIKFEDVKSRVQTLQGEKKLL